MNNRIRIFIAGLAVLLIGGGLVAYFILQDMKRPSKDAISAIPSGAFCIIEYNSISKTWEQLNQGNLIWAALCETEWAAEVSTVAAFTDSVLRVSKDYYEIVNDNRSYLSLHCTGNTELNYVFSVSLPGTAGGDKTREFIRECSKGFSFTDKTIGESILTTATRGNTKFHFCMADGVLQISDNEELLKTGVEQMKNGKSLINDRSFQAVRKTAGEKSTANIYIHYGRLLVPLKRISKKDFHPRLDLLTSFAGWTEADIHLKSNAVLLNGYTWADDSSASFLNVFRGQMPQPVEADATLPSSTVTFIDYSISNFPDYLHQYEKYLEKTGEAQDWKDRLSALSTNYSYRPEVHIGNWIGNEVVKAEVNIPGSGIRPVALISTVSTATTRQLLEALRPGNDSLRENFDSTGIVVRSVPVPEMLPATFGSTFHEFRECWYGITGHYVVFGTEESTVRSVIVSSENGRTLRKNRSYLDFISSLSSEASITYYSAVSRSFPLLDERAQGEFKADATHHKDMFSRFDGAFIQYKVDEGSLHYTNAFLRHNPESKKSISSLWETQLDTTFSGKPVLLKNHNTKGLDIFVEDDDHTIYLISSIGNIYWKRQLPSALISEVQQVDALKNGKLQIVFNTEDSIYVLDRNGNNLAPFPVKLPDKATNGIRVIDYDGKKDYRMLIACADRKVYNYNIKGEKVEGWQTVLTDSPVSLAIQHTTIGDKDFVVILDKGGKTYITDRQGKARLSLREKLCENAEAYFLEPGKDQGKTRIVAADSLGNVYRLNFSDELERIHFTGFAEKPYFEYRDINGDGAMEYLFLDKTKLQIFSQDKITLVNYGFESPAMTRFSTFRFAENDIRIGVVCPQASELHLLNKGGADSEGFPMPGQTIFCIGRLNGENGLTLVTGTNQRYLSAYSLL